MNTPRRHTWILCAAGVALLLPLAACGEDEPSSPTGGSGAGDLPQGNDPVELDPSEFTAGSDNPYFPLEPRRQWTYRETDESGSVATVVVTVTTETKQVANGIEARIVRDTVSEDGEVVEDTFDWYAQDADGNVWYLGEDTAEFEDGKLDTREGSFEAGVNGGLPGVIMPADPVAGMKYRQEYYKGQAEDNGEVLATGEQAEVAAGHYDDALLTADTSAIEPDVNEYKLSAPGVGVVLTLDVSGGAGREELLSTTKVSTETAKAAATAPLGTPYDDQG
ncbi:MAG TPA: hypothetical protein VFI99_03085 [Nocardioides sp.]|jgi:hypothetical protein|nr:hypothetical protein [Nocardioides sp.]